MYFCEEDVARFVKAMAICFSDAHLDVALVLSKRTLLVGGWMKTQH